MGLLEKLLKNSHPNCLSKLSGNNVPKFPIFCPTGSEAPHFLAAIIYFLKLILQLIQQFSVVIYEWAYGFWCIFHSAPQVLWNVRFLHTQYCSRGTGPCRPFRHYLHHHTLHNHCWQPFLNKHELLWSMKRQVCTVFETPKLTRCSSKAYLHFETISKTSLITIMSCFYMI